ncbi:MAG: (2Fe-2S)-binding protein [Deltaproteobacteria bacterium]|nr:(2Fe-2S)-binding protein [Deltaproteobacteria bacterium]
MLLRGPGKVELEVTINGGPHRIWVEPRRTLLELLRLDLGLMGAKESCGEGHCGACTVLVDAKPVYACLLPALDVEGREVTTIEGLAVDGRLHSVQQAFLDVDALQCGYCTPGQIMAVVGLLARNPRPSADDVRMALSGNLCRCGCYPRIIRAALHASAGPE